MASLPTNHTLTTLPTVRQLLDQDLRSKLPQVAKWMALLYLFFAAANYPTTADPFLRQWFTISSLSVATILGVTYFLLRKGYIAPHWAHHAAVFLMGIPMLADSLLQITLSKNPEPSVGLLLLLMGLSYFLLNTQWLGFVLGYAAVPWLVSAFWAGWGASWVNYTLAFVATIFGGLLIQTTNTRTLGRFYLLRQQEALQQAELQRRTQRLEAAVLITKQITSTLELDNLLHLAVELLVTHYAPEYVGIYQFDEAQQELTYYGGTHPGAEGYKQSVQQGLMGWAVRHKEVVCVNKTTADPRFIPASYAPHTQSELVLPLFQGAQCWGVLDVQASRPYAFRAEEIAYLTLLADQISLGVRNAILYQKEQQARQVAEALRQIGQELNSSLDLRQVLSVVLGALGDWVWTSRSSVMMQMPDGLYLMATQGMPIPPETLPRKVEPRYVMREDIFPAIFNTKRPFHIPDINQWPQWDHTGEWERPQSWLGVPLVHSGQVIGLFSLTRTTLVPFTAEEIDLALLLADQAAVALENAQLYQQVVDFGHKMEHEVQSRTAEISRAYAQLEQLDRAKGDYIRILAHEIRTPLTGLRTYTHLLQREVQKQPNGRLERVVHGLETGLERLQAMAGNINDIMRIDSGTLPLSLRYVNLAEIVGEVTETLQPHLAERALHLHTTNAVATLPTITADHDLLLKLFYNVVGNAIKYTPDGGRITLDGQPTAAPDGREGVEISVTDTGIGIAPEQLEIIFAKFFQTGAIDFYSSNSTQFKGGGPGLGLAIAQGIVTAHHGRLWATSPGYDELSLPGSTFHIWLPHRP